jgi:hypothetical protein
LFVSHELIQESVVAFLTFHFLEHLELAAETVDGAILRDFFSTLGAFRAGTFLRVGAIGCELAFGFHVLVLLSKQDGLVAGLVRLESRTDTGAMQAGQDGPPAEDIQGK